MVAKIIKDVGNYEENNLWAANTACLSNNEIQCFDGIWMLHCEKCQAWIGGPFAHTTSIHDAALWSGISYWLLNTHPLLCHHTSTPLSSNPNEHWNFSTYFKHWCFRFRGEMLPTTILFHPPSPRLPKPFVCFRFTLLMLVLQPLLGPWWSIRVNFVGNSISCCYMLICQIQILPLFLFGFIGIFLCVN